jgi:hypothetical protein
LYSFVKSKIQDNGQFVFNWKSNTVRY